MLNYMLNLLFSILLGFLLGLERELTNKQAGLRTHIFVCLGSCIFTLLSIHGFPTFVTGDNVIIAQATGIRDTSRVAAQIVTGIGFIGAGTVMKNGASVHGLTTASTLWIAAAIGMACGTGNLDIACASTIFAILILIIIKWVERSVLRKRKISNIRLRLSVKCEKCNINNLQNYIIQEFPYLSEIKKVDSDKENLVKLVAVVNVKANNPIQTLYKQLENFEGVNSITIQAADE